MSQEQKDALRDLMHIGAHLDKTGAPQTVLNRLAGVREFVASPATPVLAAPTGWTITPDENQAGKRFIVGDGSSLRSLSEEAEPTLFRFFDAMLAAAPVLPVLAAIAEQSKQPTLAYLIDPGAGSAQDSLTRYAPDDYVRANIEARGGSITELVARAAAQVPPVPAPTDDLRKAVRAMAQMLEEREWAEHVSIDPDAAALGSEITNLVGLYNDLRAKFQPTDRNAVLEEAAKEADSQTYGPCGEYDYSYDDASAKADERAESIAAAIRALKSGTPEGAAS